MSTPIETNTEQLQEILQTVYNLPNSSGGSTTPDLVITLVDPDWSGLTGHPEKCSFDPVAVMNTYTKLLSGQTVNCMLYADYFPHSGGPVKASSPQMTAFAKSEDNNSARVGYMVTLFDIYYNYDGFAGTVDVWISFNIHGDGTVTIDEFGARKFCPFTSAFI